MLGNTPGLRRVICEPIPKCNSINPPCNRQNKSVFAKQPTCFHSCGEVGWLSDGVAYTAIGADAIQSHAQCPSCLQQRHHPSWQWCATYGETPLAVRRWFDDWWPTGSGSSALGLFLEALRPVTDTGTGNSPGSGMKSRTGTGTEVTPWFMMGSGIGLQEETNTGTETQTAATSESETGALVPSKAETGTVGHLWLRRDSWHHLSQRRAVVWIWNWN